MPARPDAPTGGLAPYRLDATTAAATRAIGVRLGAALEPGDVIAIDGPFGAGKTTLVQGIAAGLGVRDAVVSPSFTLVLEYLPRATGARLPLFHLDLYRLRSVEEVVDLGIDDYLEREGALAIEWPALAVPLLPHDRLGVTIEPIGDARRLCIQAGGPRGQRLIAALAAPETV